MGIVLNHDMSIDKHVNLSGNITSIVQAVASLLPARTNTNSSALNLALYRDETKLHSFRGTQASKSSIDLYSCAGKLIRRINWDRGPIKGLGWSEDEKLIVVTADGTVRCYYDLQGDFTQFSLGNGAEEFGVTACRFDIIEIL